MEMAQESLERLERELAELRASRERLAVADDVARRRLERDLHDGPQQRLVALAVNLQLARDLLDTDPLRARTLLEELAADVQRALDETATLAQRIYPPLLEAGGLGIALRAASVAAGVQARIDVEAGLSLSSEIAGAVYFSCLAVLERAGDGSPVTVEVRADGSAVVFEIRSSARALAQGNGALHLGDRVQALGGRLTVSSEPDGGLRVRGSVPFDR